MSCHWRERLFTAGVGGVSFSIDPLKRSHDDVTRAGSLVSFPGIVASGIQQLEEGARGGFKIAPDGGEPGLQIFWLCSPWSAGSCSADGWCVLLFYFKPVTHITNIDFYFSISIRPFFLSFLNPLNWLRLQLWLILNLLGQHIFIAMSCNHIEEGLARGGSTRSRTGRSLSPCHSLLTAHSLPSTLRCSPFQSNSGIRENLPWLHAAEGGRPELHPGGYARPWKASPLQTSNISPNNPSTIPPTTFPGFPLPLLVTHKLTWKQNFTHLLWPLLPQRHWSLYPLCT